MALTDKEDTADETEDCGNRTEECQIDGVLGNRGTEGCCCTAAEKTVCPESNDPCCTNQEAEDRDKGRDILFKVRQRMFCRKAYIF